VSSVPVLIQIETGEAGAICSTSAVSEGAPDASSYKVNRLLFLGDLQIEFEIIFMTRVAP
jgi:hypothetical protein